jgi:hypothetical protein
VLVVDYKTDRLDRRDPREAADRYQVQRDLYALAAAARGAPVETAYVFLERPDHPVADRYEHTDLDQARDRVEELLGRLAEGRFEVTHEPHKGLCHDCPARERLCSHRAADMMRDSPEPPVEPRGEIAAEAGSEGADLQLSLMEGR